MEKKWKTKFVEDSFDSSDCSVVESSIQKWYDAETERLVSKGADINNIFIVADPYYNEGTIICDDYTLKFNRDEGLIDLIVNGKKDSPIWDDVIDNVPVQFATYLTGNSNFVFHFSTNIGDEMGFYEHAFWANGSPVFAELNDKWYAPIFRRCFSR